MTFSTGQRVLHTNRYGDRERVMSKQHLPGNEELARGVTQPTPEEIVASLITHGRKEAWQTIRSMIEIMRDTETEWNRVFMCAYIITEIDKEFIP